MFQNELFGIHKNRFPKRIQNKFYFVGVQWFEYFSCIVMVQLVIVEGQEATTLSISKKNCLTQQNELND